MYLMVSDGDDPFERSQVDFQTNQVRLASRDLGTEISRVIAYLYYNLIIQ